MIPGCLPDINMGYLCSNVITADNVYTGISEINTVKKYW
jgi:hypothetical protein